jgi:hypothetical protein
MIYKQFRFEDFEIWKEGLRISSYLFQIARLLETSKQFAFADQLRRATISITNNIAEGSGSTSKKDLLIKIEKTTFWPILRYLVKKSPISKNPSYPNPAPCSLLPAPCHLLYGKRSPGHIPPTACRFGSGRRSARESHRRRSCRWSCPFA